MKRKKPLVSVILPVFNGGKYLSLALDSILNQTLTDFEVICIDDGSKDDTWAILTEYSQGDERIKVYRNVKNQRLARTLNRGLRLARGKYIARMDADDVCLPGRFEKQVELLERNRDLVAVGCQEEIIDEKGKVTAEKYFPTDPVECYQVLANVMPIQPPALMVRGVSFRKYRYDAKHCPDDDIDIYFKLLGEGNFSNVDEILLQYRQLGDSLTHRRIRQVYFMALKIRLRGIFLYNYRPAVGRVFLALLETVFVALMPETVVKKTFEWMRYRRIVSDLIPSWTLGILRSGR